ncbi:hypothetical protein SAMN05421827_13030 [Pedobacter terrae]|uniref:Uncharacterized protein n=1 Tax=Pedobacter terrae TaxID=405671 RepID=A0A1G8DNQ0_9SPHI|nr:hypothetical protein SAMN05421827_13030 [Pedobacter terrae]
MSALRRSAKDKPNSKPTFTGSYPLLLTVAN